MKTLALLALLALATVALTGPALAQASQVQADQGNIPAYDYGAKFAPPGASMSNFTLYTLDSNGDQKAQDATKAVSILTDVPTGQEYLIITVPGQPPMITPRVHNEYIPHCEQQDGFDCLQKGTETGGISAVLGPNTYDARLNAHAREIYEWTQGLIVAVKDTFLGHAPGIEKQN